MHDSIMLLVKSCEDILTAPLSTAEGIGLDSPSVAVAVDAADALYVPPVAR
jgi:hypothetical protein